MTDSRGVRLDADDLASLTATKQAGIIWPFPADRRLDQLVEASNRAGARVRRSELVAALVAAAPADSQQLLQMVIAWRTCHVREVVVGVDDAARVVEIPRYPPGRRRADAG